MLKQAFGGLAWFLGTVQLSWLLYNLACQHAATDLLALIPLLVAVLLLAIGYKWMTFRKFIVAPLLSVAGIGFLVLIQCIQPGTRGLLYEVTHQSSVPHNVIVTPSGGQLSVDDEEPDDPLRAALDKHSLRRADFRIRGAQGAEDMPRLTEQLLKARGVLRAKISSVEPFAAFIMYDGARTNFADIAIPAQFDWKVEFVKVEDCPFSTDSQHEALTSPLYGSLHRAQFRIVGAKDVETLHAIDRFIANSPGVYKSDVNQHPNAAHSNWVAVVYDADETDLDKLTKPEKKLTGTGDPSADPTMFKGVSFDGFKDEILSGMPPTISALPTIVNHSVISSNGHQTCSLEDQGGSTARSDASGGIASGGTQPPHKTSLSKEQLDKLLED